MSTAREIHRFWFGDPPYSPRAMWFPRDDVARARVDADVRYRFEDDVDAAARGDRDAWADDASSFVSLLLLLDQFPRNLFRGTARAFATDEKARDVAARAVVRGFDQDLSPVERWFVYLPYEHSEDLNDQERALFLFQGLAHDESSAQAMDFARQHHALIARFGRFPGRNQALGRATTADEQRWLDEHPDHF